MKSFCACLFILCLSWPLSKNPATAAGSTVTTNITTAAKTNDSQTTVAVQAPIAEKLIRFRRQPPVTIIKHVIRSSKRSKPRRRIKRPKIRYGPPPASASTSNFGFDEQLSYYKPSEAHSFSFDEFQNLKLDAADFELPPSSYEAQSMDLDFYSHSDDEVPSYQSISKYPTLTTSTDEYGSSDVGLDLDNHNIQTSYVYKPPAPLPRKPHQKYGLPKTLDYSSDFNTADSPSYFPPNDYSSYNLYESKTPQQTSYGSDSGSKYQATESNIPTSHYNIESDTADVFNSHHTYSAPKRPKPQYEAPISNSGSYNTYDKKIPNVSYGQSYEPTEYSEPLPTGPPVQSTDYSQSFGSQHHYEDIPSLPAQQPTSKPAPDIEFTYSPSYEVNLLTPNKNSHNSGNRQQHHLNEHPDQQPGNFAEPPPAPPVNKFHAGHIPQQPGAIDDYVPPTQELPLNPHHKQPAYDFPKSSYEVPIYDPIPFDASTTDEQEYYPPVNQYDAQPQTPEETRQRETSFPSNYQDDQQQQHQTPSDLAPNFDRDAHASESDLSATSTTKLQRNRKRPKNPLAGTTKHTLDVPELKKAYDAAKQNKQETYPTRQTDAEVNASTYIEEKQAFLPTQPGLKKENYFGQTWNPMRVRTPTHLASVGKTTERAVTSTTTSKNSRAPQFRPRPRPRLTPTVPPTPSKPRNIPTTHNVRVETTKNPTKPIEIVSIEKSHSQSYYDGTLAPPILTMSNLYETRLNKFKTPTRQPTLKPLSLPKQPTTQRPYKDVPAAKRTTKSIFDTTHFKAPQNDRAVAAPIPYNIAQTLPKNHKFF